jgi:hypothetical protein
MMPTFWSLSQCASSKRPGPQFNLRPEPIRVSVVLASNHVELFSGQSRFSYLSNTGNFVELSIVRPQWPILVVFAALILNAVYLLPTPVCTENSASHVVVMQSAQERMRRDAPDPLNRRMPMARNRCLTATP